VRLGADEDFSGKIIRGVLRRNAEIDLIRFPEVGLKIPDEVVLEWAESEGRILLSHDVNTMKDSANKRVLFGFSHPGVLIVPQWAAILEIIEDIKLIAECSLDDEWRNQVKHLPLNKHGA